MGGISQTFAWGVFLACVGLVALAVLAGVAILTRQLVAMASRLIPVPAVVEDMQGPLAEAAKRLAKRPDLRPLQYRYEVAGQTHIGTLATLQSGPAARRAAETALAAHRPGDTITVFYDRAHPSRSVIDASAPVTPAWVRWAWAAAAGAVATGVVMAVVGY